MGLFFLAGDDDAELSRHSHLFEMEKVVLGNRTIHLRSFDLAELETFLKSLGAPRYRAAQIMDWLHRKHAMTFSEMKNIPKELQSVLAEKTVVGVLKLIDVVNGTADHESIKYLMKTEDGHILESVLI